MKRQNAIKLVTDCLDMERCSICTKKPYTVAELYATIAGVQYRGCKIATCGKGDVWNDDVGKEIARGRALLEIVKKARLLGKVGTNE